MMKIDENSVIPLGWVLSGVIAILTFTALGVFWIASVNFRLERIEDKLGIPAFHATLSLPITEAKANGLPNPVQQLRPNRQFPKDFHPR